MGHIPSDLRQQTMNIRKCITLKSEYFQIKESCSYLLVYRTVEVYEETFTVQAQIAQSYVREPCT